MARSKKDETSSKNGNGANLGFEQTLWATADKMRGHMDSAEYKHVALGLIFLKYISDAFQELYDDLAKRQETDYTEPEDRDEYLGMNVFWVPKEARWTHIQANAKQPTIGKLIDEAMLAIEKENSRLKGVLPMQYARPDLDKQRLGELIDLISTLGLGDTASRSKDILGRVYEYFLGQFAEKEGKGGGEFYTPQSVVKLLVAMIEPYKGRIYDPCCGSGGMFVQSEKFVEAHGGRKGDIAIYGQESNPTTRRLCLMNLAIRGIDGNIGDRQADSFTNDLHKDLKADYILANPPFNISDWWHGSLADDVRWQYGTPPKGNANYGWVQHMIHHLSPNGIAGFVLANGSMSSNQSGEGEIRKAMVEADQVDCMIALPGQLFYTTQIPACLWFVTRNKKGFVGAKGFTTLRDRRGETLFIDARKLGVLIDRTHRDLSDEVLARIATTYHAWRGEPEAVTYADVPGFCKSATMAEIQSHGYVLTPGRYVGAEEVEDDDEPFEEKMQQLTAKLEELRSRHGWKRQSERICKDWAMATNLSRWSVYTIDELKADSGNAIAIGPFGSRMRSDCYVSVGIPVIRGNNISTSRSFKRDFVYITEDKADALRSSNVFADDLFFPHRGAIGEVGIISKDDRQRYVLSSSLMKLTCNKKIVEPLYLLYFFRSPQERHELLKNASTVGTPGIATPLASLKSISVLLPPLDEQKAIAHILGTLDDKIELNPQLNHTLESVARALFKSWFIDFDPVRAKLDGRQPAGMDAETAALFPAEFEDSAIDEIPTGWRSGVLKDISENPKRTIRPEQIPVGTPYVGLEHMPKRSIALSDWGVSDNVESNKFQFENGDILFGKLRPYFHKVGVAIQNGVCSTDILVIIPKCSEWFSLALAYVSSDEFVEYTNMSSDGTRMPRTNWQVMGQYPITIPSFEVAKAFNTEVSVIVQTIRSNIFQLKTLASIRDALLPKLLSGEIHVKDAEKVIEEVA